MSLQKYGLIGHPLGHSMSSFIHKRLFELSKINASYDIFDIPTKELDTYIPELNKLSGYNVTIPYKRVIIQYLDKLSRKSQMYGSVNTVLNNYLTEGHTTDADGFLKSLEKENVSLDGRVVILGAGGVARTLAYESVISGADTTIAVAPFDLTAAACLSGEIKNNFSRWEISTCLIDRIKGPIDLLINATPVGMYPKIDDMPVNSSVLANCHCVFDAVYNPINTKLLQAANANGVKAISGISMLVYQAMFSHQIWYDAKFSDDDINMLCEDTRIQQEKLF